MTDQPYRTFARVFGDSTPLRSERELDAAIQAARLSREDVTRAWLQSLRPAWVYGEVDVPFANDALNRRYIRMLFS